jgi:nucleoside-diphosphate kinase
VAIGRMVKEWLMDFISSGNVVAMVLEGNAAVINVRRLCGGTFPIFAGPGSIRGRFSVESPDFANAEKRPVQNLVHASGKIEEAKYEIGIWFPHLSEAP